MTSRPAAGTSFRSLGPILALLLLMTVAPDLRSEERATYRWIEVTDRAPFAPRDGAGALVFRGRMWLLGGWNPGDREHFPRICNNEVWSSADGAGWTLIKPNTFRDDRFDPTRDWEGRHTAGYAVFQRQDVDRRRRRQPGALPR